MLIEHIHVRNFKSIKEATLNLEPLTVIVGANAAGKSNIINVFRFISNIITVGIDNAIALQGGIPYLTNACLKKGTPIEISFTVNLSSEGWVRHSDIKHIGFEIERIHYHFIIQPNLRGNGYHIYRDTLQFDFKCMKVNASAKKEDRYTDMSESLTFLFDRKTPESSVKVSFSFSDNSSFDNDTKEKIKQDTSAFFFCKLANENKKELMLYRMALLLPPFFSEDSLIRIFDFDPRVLKASSSMVSIEKVFVVQFEIESWYYAGASEDDCHKLKLRHFIFCTDNLTKEEFQSKLVRTSDKKYIMDSLLDIYSLQYAVTRNHSLMIFTQAVYEKAYSAVS